MLISRKESYISIYYLYLLLCISVCTCVIENDNVFQKIVGRCETRTTVSIQSYHDPLDPYRFETDLLAFAWTV